MNCFVLKGVVTDFKLESIFKGAFLFMIPLIITVGLLYYFLEIALYFTKYYEVETSSVY